MKPVSMNFGSYNDNVFEGVYLEQGSDDCTWRGRKDTVEGTVYVEFWNHDMWYGSVTWIPESGDVTVIGKTAATSDYCGTRLKREIRRLAVKSHEERKQLAKLDWLFDVDLK